VTAALRQGDDCNAVVRPVPRKLARDRLDDGASRARVGHGGHSVVRGDGHVYDRPPAGGPHRQLVGGLAHRQGASDVQALDRAPALRHDRLGGDEVLAAGVVEEEVEPAVAIERRLHDGRSIVPFPDVPGHP
jgi:hypothetical protein